jgi:hypothetical protein
MPFAITDPGSNVPVEFMTAAVALFGVPILFLVLEYVYQTDTTLLAVFQKSGPDLCLIGLGSSGSVFIDPRVISSFRLPSQLCLIIVIVVILILRRISVRVESEPQTWRRAITSSALGLGSIAMVLCVLMYGYL